MQTAINNLSIKTLLKFTFPSIVSMLCISLYSIVDGLFVARFVGSNALAAVNVAYPFLGLVFAFGTMFGTGGNAIVAKNLGEKNIQSARKNISLIYLVGAIFGTLLMVVSQFFPKEIALFTGASDLLLDDSIDYIKYTGLFTIPTIFQVFAQSFLVTSGKSQYVMLLTIAAGVCNIVLDYIFIVPLEMGVKGAALATGISTCIPAVFGLLEFYKAQDGKDLYFVTPSWNNKVLLQTAYNGSSEGVVNLATGITTIMFNIIIYQFLKEDGIAAISAILYIQFVMSAIFIGFGLGIAPIFSYTYGSRETDKTKLAFRFSMSFILILSIISYGVFIYFADSLLLLFFSADSSVFKIAKEGLVICLISIGFAGMNIFFSALFTAFSNGTVSAVISFCRTFGFIILTLYFLPNIIGVQGVWLAIPVAELLSLFVGWYYLFRYKTQYQY